MKNSPKMAKATRSKQTACIRHCAMKYKARGHLSLLRREAILMRQLILESHAGAC